MIQAITDYIVGQLQTIRQKVGEEWQPVQVYAPGPYRDHGETVYPNVALSLASFLPDSSRARPHLEVFEASAELQTVQIDEQSGRFFPAVTNGAEQEPYQIEEGVHDVIRFRVGGAGAWLPEQSLTLIYGERNASEICAQINAWTTGVLAAAKNGHIHLETEAVGADLEIFDGEASAWATLGFTPGVISHLSRTGPASWTVRRCPTPVKVLYQADINTVDPAQQIGLWNYVMDLLPSGHRPWINGQSPSFHMAPPTNLDELEKPRYRTAFRWWVSNIWIDRIRAYSVQSILEMQFGIDA